MRDVMDLYSKLTLLYLGLFFLAYNVYTFSLNTSELLGVDSEFTHLL